MPGNRAIAFGPEIDYAILTVTEIEEGSLAKIGEKLVVAEALLTNFTNQCKIESFEITALIKGESFKETICNHPLNGKGYDFNVYVLPANFANTEEGTGFVHIAPGHGDDDWELGRINNLEIPQTVNESGCFYDHVPIFAGMHVYNCNDRVAEILATAGGLLGKSKLIHRYPHSWRSKKPLIF